MFEDVAPGELGVAIAEARRSMARRQRRRITQRQVAEALGVHELTVTAWETGKQKPDPENLAKLARFFEAAEPEARPALREQRVAYPTSSERLGNEAEDWLATIVSPDLIRRFAGTPTYVDIIIGAKEILARGSLPLEAKNAVDALLNQMLADVKTP